MPPSPLDAARRQSLLEAKLKSLVRSRWPDAADQGGFSAFPGGAGLVHGDRAWVLAEDAPQRSLGPALAWALRRDAATLDLIVPTAPGGLARRAGYFARPIMVWSIQGRDVVAAEPQALIPDPPLDPRAEPFRDLIVQAGADPVVEHGHLLGEVRGLEVARVVIEPEGAHIEIGVGKHDRELQRMMRGDAPSVEDLFGVVRAVLERRRSGGEGHDAYHLAPERWLRSVVVRHPQLVGATWLEPVASPVARDDLRRPAPAPAAGVDSHGSPLLVVCSYGVDVDLVPAAADARAADERDPRLLICVPEADDHRFTHDLAGALAEPAEVVTVPPHWRSL